MSVKKSEPLKNDLEILMGCIEQNNQDIMSAKPLVKIASVWGAGLASRRSVLEISHDAPGSM